MNVSIALHERLSMRQLLALYHYTASTQQQLNLHFSFICLAWCLLLGLECKALKVVTLAAFPPLCLVGRECAWRCARVA